MYISSQNSYDRNNVLVWERSESGRLLKKYKAPYYFYVPDTDGNYSDMFNVPLKRINCDDYDDFVIKKQRYGDISQYESDISTEQKILFENYVNKPLKVTPHISFFDIEVDYDRRRGFTIGKDFYAPISTISLCHFWNNKVYVLSVPPENSPYEPTNTSYSTMELPKELTDIAEIIFFKNETELLNRFFELIKDTDVISGWNSEYFDIPYIYERCLLLGLNKKSLCFPEASNPRYKMTMDKNGKETKVLKIFGREHLDYLLAFKKFEMTERPSYSLDNISNEISPELPKLNYEGSLYTLYRKDFIHYLRYSIRDSECLLSFENKLGYIRLAIELSNNTTSDLNSVLGTLTVVQNAIIQYLHNDINKRVPNSKFKNDSEDNNVARVKFAGAAVITPIPGLYEYGGAIDINSLYPNTICSLFISPDSIIGQFEDTHKDFQHLFEDDDCVITFRWENGKTRTEHVKFWQDYLKENNYVVSGYGTVFWQKEDAILPTMLARWFNLRIEYQTLKKKHDKLRDQATTNEEKNHHKQQYEYYDRLQYIYKILLNSTYGALGNKHFKFFDVRLAESTTRSGRKILMHQTAQTALFMDGEYIVPDEYIDFDDPKHPTVFKSRAKCNIYGDTDSTHFLTYATNIEDAVKKTEECRDFVNPSFPIFLKRAFNTDICRIKTSLDFVMDRGIYVKKKMYILHKVNSEGKFVDEMKVMGLQIKKSSIPKPVGEFLTNIFERYLKGANWKRLKRELVEYRDKIIDSDDLSLVGMPQSVNNIDMYYEHYLNKTTGVTIPGAVRAAILYNICLKQYNDLESIPITSGTKIRRYILKTGVGKYQNKKYEFTSIALPTDLTIVPDWFLNYWKHNIDTVAQAERLIVKPVENILVALGEKMPSTTSLLFDEMFQFKPLGE